MELNAFTFCQIQLVKVCACVCVFFFVRVFVKEQDREVKIVDWTVQFEQSQWYSEIDLEEIVVAVG